MGAIFRGFREVQFENLHSEILNAFITRLFQSYRPEIRSGNLQQLIRGASENHEFTSVNFLQDGSGFFENSRQRHFGYTELTLR